MTAVQSIELLQDFLSSLREEGVDPLKFILALGHLKPLDEERSDEHAVNA